MNTNKPILSVRDLLERLGADEVRAAIFPDAPPSLSSGKRPGQKALEQAAWRGVLPANHFGAIEVLCNRQGIECPRHLFSFKFADATNVGGKE